jgi:predicted glycosyltransferase
MSLKLLICTNETLGLGHLRRALRIAGGLHAEIPNLSTLVLTGSAMVHGFRLPAGVDYVKLPSLLKETKLAYTSKCLPLPFEEIGGCGSRSSWRQPLPISPICFS